MAENFDPNDPNLLQMLGEDPTAPIRLRELKPWVGYEQVQYLVNI